MVTHFCDALSDFCVGPALGPNRWQRARASRARVKPNEPNSRRNPDESEIAKRETNPSVAGTVSTLHRHRHTRIGYLPAQTLPSAFMISATMASGGASIETVIASVGSSRVASWLSRRLAGM
jgi:hypothetical protein